MVDSFLLDNNEGISCRIKKVALRIPCLFVLYFYGLVCNCDLNDFESLYFIKVTKNKNQSESQYKRFNYYGPSQN